MGIRLVPALAIGGALLAAGLGTALYLYDPPQRCVDAGGRWDKRRRACEMTPPDLGPPKTSDAGAAGAARTLDVTSFATELPKKAGARTLIDFGFTQVLRTRDGVELYTADQGAMFGIRVLEEEPGRKLLCITEARLTGGVRSNVRAIEARPAEGDFWRATGPAKAHPGCG